MQRIARSLRTWAQKVKLGTKTYFFTLYSLTFSVTGEINLLNITKDFSPEAEIEYYNRSKSEIKLHLVTDLSKEQVEKICDDFKIKIESNFDTRLVYKVTRITLQVFIRYLSPALDHYPYKRKGKMEGANNECGSNRQQCQS